MAAVLGESGGGVEHGDLLVHLAEAAVVGEPAALAGARDALMAATSEPFLVDAAAVIANFEMMTRVADTTGAAHAVSAEEGTAAVRARLGVDGYTSARWG